MNRREFLLAGAALCTLMVVPKIACANTKDFWERDRVLWVRRKETGEAFRVVYWSHGMVDPDNYMRLCYLLRDVQENKTVMMDVNLLNLLYGIQYWQELLLGRPTEIIATDGYRTDRTNDGIENAAKHSEHKHGKAGDIQHKIYTPDQLAGMASFFGMGGVGRYPNHAHIDSGRVRFWNGSYRRKR